MSKKRPGVDASIRLAAACTTGDDDATLSLWERVEQQYESIRSTKLLQAEQAWDKSFFPSNDDEELHEIRNQQELLKIVAWKFAVGKPRPQLLGLIRSNTDQDIRRYTSEGIQIARHTGKDSKNYDDDDDDSTIIKDAINSISSNLQGVGPATASAILARACPHKFCYMYDEVIDTFVQSKRTYTLNVYLQINNECTRLANELNCIQQQQQQQQRRPSGGSGSESDGSGSEWTTARVARTLWIAARVLAAGDGEDLTSKSKAASTAAAAAAATSSDRKKRTAAAAAAVGTTGKTSSSDTTKKRRTTKSRK
mmetsp:Transcript_56356/g.136699  ORF Transcript_56356/g.136699 Transcript_56356/m.136699 type:complete len:310 (-) Transcript_56356:145-1074(-)